VKIAKTVEPNPRAKPVYDELHGIYHRLNRNTCEEMHRLATINRE